MTDAVASQTKTMKLRYAGRCRECGSALAAGTVAVYDRIQKTVYCVDCPSDFEQLESDQLAVIFAGEAGASAQREHDKRSERRETRIREKHPKIGGLILALSDDPQSTRAWETGARGEVVLGARLDKAVRDDLRVLHDRLVPGTRANIDHIVVGPAGVFVIDAKRYAGAPTLRVEGGFFSPRVSKLMVGSRDQTKLVAGVQRQVARVQVALRAAGLESVHLSGMLCFVDGEWPLFGGDFVVEGVNVLWPRKAVELVGRSGDLSASEVDRVWRMLAGVFAAA